MFWVHKMQKQACWHQNALAVVLCCACSAWLWHLWELGLHICNESIANALQDVQELVPGVTTMGEPEQGLGEAAVPLAHFKKPSRRRRAKAAAAKK